MTEIIKKDKEQMNEVKQETSKAMQRQSQQPEDKRYLIPATDIYETDDEIKLICDMPGVKKEDINVSVKNDELIILGKTGLMEDEEDLIYTEIYHYDYKRIFVLSDTIDREKIQAKIESGVLYITLPKEERVIPREIPINMK